VKFEATANEIRTLLHLAKLKEGSSKRAARSRGGRAALAKGLPQGVLERYDELVRAHRSPAVARIERGTCSGCHIRLPTMIEYKILHSLALYTCPRCRRLIYAPELLDSAAETEPATRRRRVAGGQY